MHVKTERYTSPLSSKGQVTVPHEIRERLGVKGGDRIEFVVEDGRHSSDRFATIRIPSRSTLASLDHFQGVKRGSMLGSTTCAVKTSRVTNRHADRPRLQYHLGVVVSRGIDAQHSD